VPAPPRPAQLALFEPAGPSPERLATTLARLGAMCGGGRVGVPVVPDTHIPGTVALGPFAARSGAHLVSCSRDHGRQATHGAAIDLPLVTCSLRPPRPAEVLLRGHLPAFLRAAGVAGRVVEAGGPYRLRSMGPVGSMGNLRDYYDVELDDGIVYRLFCDLCDGRWFLDARYD
jgi:hypothetical protein